MSKISIYKEAAVILTARGADLVNTYYHMQPANTPREKEANLAANYQEGDIFKGPLYLLMDIFGRWMYDGCLPLFKDDYIEI